MKANDLRVKFGAFRIRDMDSGLTLIDVKEEDLDTEVLSEEMDPSMRLLKYHFGPDFLELHTIGL